MKIIRKIFCYVMIFALVPVLSGVPVSGVETQSEPQVQQESYELDEGEGPQAPLKNPKVLGLGHQIETLTSTTCNVKFTWYGQDVTSYELSVSINDKAPSLYMVTSAYYTVKGLKAGEKCSIEVTPVYTEEGLEPIKGKSAKRTVAINKPAEITGFEAHPDYNSVYLRWDPVPGHTGGYAVLKNGKIINKTNTKNFIREKDGKLAYRAPSGQDSKGLGIMYSWAVAPVSNEGVVGKSTPTLKAKRVETMYIVGNTKTRASYYSKHKKGRVLGKLSKGAKVYATDYKGGRYGFIKNGRKVWLNRLNLNTSSSISSSATSSGAKLRYKLEGYRSRTADARYSNITKENYFMRRAGGKPTVSGTRYAVWISLHTQDITVFRNVKWPNKSNPDWKVHKEFWCSSGKSGTPTLHVNASIHKQTKWSKWRSLKWWSYFAGGNAMHTKRKNNVMGVAPMSHGCVRMEEKDAKWIYYNCPIGTKVFIY